MKAGAGIQVEVVFATPYRQELIGMTVDPGATVADVIAATLPSRFPDEPLSALQAGIWGRPVDRSRVLSDGDRVELYRPLRRDPKEARRELAAAGKSMSDSEPG